MKARGVGAALVVTSALAAPRVAHACYVCMSGREDDSGRAFLLGSVLLSVLPFALFGGIALWIWRRVRAAEREQAASEPPRGAARVPAPDGEEIGARPV